MLDQRSYGKQWFVQWKISPTVLIRNCINRRCVDYSCSSRPLPGQISKRKSSKEAAHYVRPMNRDTNQKENVLVWSNNTTFPSWHLQHIGGELDEFNFLCLFSTVLQCRCWIYYRCIYDIWWSGHCINNSVHCTECQQRKPLQYPLIVAKLFPIC